MIIESKPAVTLNKVYNNNVEKEYLKVTAPTNLTNPNIIRFEIPEADEEIIITKEELTAYEQELEAAKANEL